MMRFILLALLLPVTLLAADLGARGPHAIEEMAGEWTDAARENRVIPYRIYLPANLDAPAPVVLFSHGLGGSRDGYRYFGEHLASHGYVSVHLQHAGSDTAMLRESIARGEKLTEAMQGSAGNLRNALDRPRDVSFAIDQLTQEAKLRGRLDLERIAVAGHSFGAYTAMAIAGQGAGRLRDARVKSVIAMSAPAPRGGAGYANVTIPVLVMTGTLDDSPIGGGTAKSRIDAFATFTGNERYLVVFDGGDHMIFSGSHDALARLNLPGHSGDRSRDPAFQAHIQRLGLAFLEHTLKGDKGAKEILTASHPDYTLTDRR